MKIKLEGTYEHGFAATFKGPVDLDSTSDGFSWDRTFRPSGSRRLRPAYRRHHLALFSIFVIETSEAPSGDRYVDSCAYGQNGGPKPHLAGSPIAREHGQHATGLGPQYASLPVK